MYLLVVAVPAVGLLLGLNALDAGSSTSPGAPLGEPQRVRIALRDAASTERFLGALDKALARAE